MLSLLDPGLVRCGDLRYGQKENGVTAEDGLVIASILGKSCIDCDIV